MENNSLQSTVQPAPPLSSSLISQPSTTEPTKEVQPEEKKVEIPQENWRVSPLFYEVAQYLGVDEREYEKAAPKMSLIVDWAITQTKSNKMHDILPIISQLEQKLMKPTWGETRYGVLYRYLRLAIKRDAFEKALSAFKVKGEK